MNFSLHTVELRKYVNLKTYSYLRVKYFNKTKDGKPAKEDDCETYSHQFKGQGIVLFLKKEKYRWYLAVTLSLNSILGGRNSIELVRHEDITSAYHEADRKISDRFGEDYSLGLFELWRVDFCVNLRVGSPDDVKEYIRLMYKTQKKKSFKVRGLGNKSIIKSRSFTARKRSDTEISIYDKREALLDWGYEEAEQAAGILRIEPRLLNKRTVDLYAPDGDNADRIAHCAKISRNVITNFMEDFCMDADYYKLNEAERLIDERVDSRKMRERMKLMIKCTAELHGIKNAKKILVGSDKAMSHDYYNQMMDEFVRIGVNVVTLAKNREGKYMPSLFRYIYEV